MNIHDFDSPYTKKDLPKAFEIIFKKQHELAEKYVIIEMENDLRHTTDIPVSLNDKKGQAQLKDFAWRITEEIAESCEALEEWLDKNSNLGYANEQLIHGCEELADALHFMTELAILSDLSHLNVIKIIKLETYNPGKETYFTRAMLNAQVYKVIYLLGNTMNLLKNKPWKNTQYKTDDVRFKKGILNSYNALIDLMILVMSPIDILNYYFRKSKVNDFRIESKY